MIRAAVLPLPAASQAKSTQPFVSVCFLAYNGEPFIREALDSLLAQDYLNLEVILLGDSRAPARTGEICREYERRDPRVRYVLDDIHRISHEAGNRLAELACGEYLLFCCDDDVWHPDCIRKLVGYLERHPEVGLAFPNADYIEPDGTRTGKPVLRGGRILRSGDTPFRAFARYLWHQSVVPTIFGVFRAADCRKALPFDTFDETIADVDNLFILTFLTRSKVHCLDEILFSYRRKFRWADPDGLPNYPRNNNPLWVWVYFTRHQLRFTRKILDLIRRSPFSTTQKVALRAETLVCLLKRVTLDHLKRVLGQWWINSRYGPRTRMTV